MRFHGHTDLKHLNDAFRKLYELIRSVNNTLISCEYSATATVFGQIHDILEKFCNTTEFSLLSDYWAIQDFKANDTYTDFLSAFTVEIFAILQHDVITIEDIVKVHNAFNPSNIMNWVKHTDTLIAKYS